MKRQRKGNFAVGGHKDCDSVAEAMAVGQQLALTAKKNGDTMGRWYVSELGNPQRIAVITLQDGVVHTRRIT